MCSVMSDSATPWTVVLQAPLSMGFPRQEYWSGLPLLTPGDLPIPGIKLCASYISVYIKHNICYMGKTTVETVCNKR